jgi:hypothetical protein
MRNPPHWLSRKRLFVGAALSLACFLFFAIGIMAASKPPAAGPGYTLGSDFVTFWGASRLAQEGRAQDAYDRAKLTEAERSAVPGVPSRAWYYPPTFLLAVYPLASLPYAAAFIGFMAITLGAYLWLGWRVIGNSDGMLCLAASGAVWINLMHGQNGFLTAVLAGAAMLQLERRPLLAGACIGLLAIKPHLAVFFPLALAAAGAWRAFAAAAITGVIFVAASALVLGVETFSAFHAGLGLASQRVETGDLPLFKMPSVFAAVRSLGMGPALAYGAHMLAALVVGWLVWRSWRDKGPLPLRASLLMCASFFVSPYGFDYDLTWLAFPIAWIARDGMQRGWLPGEREILVLAWLLPVLSLALTLLAPVQLAPLVLAGMIYCCRKRLRDGPAPNPERQVLT